MCSIAGSINKKEVQEMLQKMKHRSPDDEGIVEGDFTMGMGRLAVIDLNSSGLCPYVEDNLVLAFNGEIYNYIELREELKRLGQKFRTESDTEVLLKAYRQWGLGALDRLNGMFAFAIKDNLKIILARDIAGEKPLYYTEEPFRFASEAKALSFDCKELPPAHFAVYENGRMTIGRWWRFYRRQIDPSAAEDELETLLEDSIRLRTRSDVPYGLYLSGGVDSALISTFHDFKYTFTYKDGDYKDHYLKDISKILWHLDGPTESFSPFGLWKLAEMASDKVKVVLSGEGADELFGGYVRYVEPEFHYQAQKKFPSYKGMFEFAISVNEYGWNEFNGNLQELLRMGDRMATAFGLENRCPFLDRRIIEFAFSLPNELKINGLDTKVILNRVLKKRFPQYQPQEKHGLFCSVNKWIGSKQQFDKDDYMKFQEKQWNSVLLSQRIADTPLQ